jgi:uncharacterized membrane protein (UPF0127 family)
MKNILLLVLISLGLGYFLFQKYKTSDLLPFDRNQWGRVEILDEHDVLVTSFKVELAQTEKERLKGLMGRENLPADQGMLFIYNRQQPLSFWMKDTLISLDIIYLSQEKKIIKVIARALPCKQITCPGYPSMEPAMYVLEINGGLSEKLMIKEGMRAEFDIISR